MQKLLLYFILLFLLSLHSLSFAQDKEELIKVTSQLYMISGLGGNVTFLVTDDGVLLVDTGTRPQYAAKIQKYISSVTDKKIKYIVLTHYHFDHYFGIYGYDKTYTLIGHENITNNIKYLGKYSLDSYRNINLPNEVKKAKFEADSLKKINSDKWNESQANYNKLVEQLETAKKMELIYPDVTFKDQMNIYLGKDTITLRSPGNTHTSCNILVEFQNQNAVATGDFLFNNRMPYIDYYAKCNTKNWIEQLKKPEVMKYKYIIPGHGQLAESKDLLREAEYIADLREAIQSCISKNKSIDEAKKEIKMEKYSGFGFQQMLPAEIEAVYKEMKDRK